MSETLPPIPLALLGSLANDIARSQLRDNWEGLLACRQKNGHPYDLAEKIAKKYPQFAGAKMLETSDAMAIAVAIFRA
jgi:hypothetical protein